MYNTPISTEADKRLSHIKVYTMFKANQFISSATINRLMDEEIAAMNQIIGDSYKQIGVFVDHRENSQEVIHAFVEQEDGSVGVLTTNYSDQFKDFVEVRVEDVLRVLFGKTIQIIVGAMLH